MKNLFSFILSFLFIGVLNARDNKEIVFVEYFSYTNSIGTSYVETLRTKIIEGLVKTDRLLVKDVDSDASLRREKEKQSEDASNIDNERLTAMRSLNAKYLVQGHITTMGTTKNEVDGKTKYVGNIAYSLKVIDVASGTLKETKSFNNKGTRDNPTEAIESALSGVISDMRVFVNDCFPVEGSILEIKTVKKDKATEVYIDLGTIKGMQKNQRFKVYVEREIAGRKSQKEIGELKVEAVEGDDISLCKVTKGGDQIKSAIGEGKVLTVKSISKEGPFDGLF